MKITLLGFGKMGRMIASLALPKHSIVSIIDPQAPEATHRSISEEALKQADAVIDFSQVSSVEENVRQVSVFRKNMIVGTTGWHEKVPAVKAMVEQSGIGFLYASNFSIGVHLFLKLVGEAAKFFSRFDQYDVFGHEYHHNQKVDSPSGTALSLGKILLANFPRKKELLTETSHEKVAPEKLHFTSTRGGSIPGTHQVFFDSEADTMEISHTARSRAGFAAGALKAAEWLQGKRGFFTLEDYLADILK